MRRVKFDIPVFVSDEETSPGTYWFDIQNTINIHPRRGDNPSGYSGFVVRNPGVRGKHIRGLFFTISVARFDGSVPASEWTQYDVQPESNVSDEEYKKILDKITEFNSSKFNTNDALPSVNLTEFVKSVKPNLHILLKREDEK